MTRGIRNNNPLNIRHSADQWQGARAQQTDPSFVQFESMVYGYRAAWKVLETYWNHFTGHGLAFNVRTIISRWAPPKENDTENYIRTVLLISGLGGMENLPQPSRKVDEERLVRLIGAMTCVEGQLVALADGVPVHLLVAYAAFHTSHCPYQSNQAFLVYFS